MKDDLYTATKRSTPVAGPDPFITPSSAFHVYSFILLAFAGSSFHVHPSSFAHSGLIPAAWATFAHFRVSARMKAPNSSALPATTVPPSLARRPLTSGARR